MKPTISRGVAAAAASLLVLAAACSDARDPLSPKLQAWNQPPPPQTGELSGVGMIRSSMDEVTFTFDVTSDATGVHGRFSAVDGTGSTLNATAFSAFRSTSGFCATPSHGAEFDATGTLVEAGVASTVTFTVKACDNGPAIVGMDTFSIDIPSHSFHEQGTVVGDIQKR